MTPRDLADYFRFYFTLILHSHCKSVIRHPNKVALTKQKDQSDVKTSLIGVCDATCDVVCCDACGYVCSIQRSVNKNMGSDSATFRLKFLFFFFFSLFSQTHICLQRARLLIILSCCNCCFYGRVIFFFLSMYFQLFIFNVLSVKTIATGQCCTYI